MAVIKYIGKYVNAEDAVTCFDYTNIETAIKNIKDGAEKLEKAARRLQGAETYYTKETFSINGETFDNRIERCANYFLSTAEYMEELTELIKIRILFFIMFISLSLNVLKLALFLIILSNI